MGIPADHSDVELRLGDTWVELRLSNGGPVPVLVSLDEATFTTPDGVEHRLIESSQLQRLANAQTFGDPARRNGAGGASLSISPAMAYHAFLPGSEADSAPRSLAIAAGQSVQLVFFPVEHVRIEPSGFTTVMPLFCDGSASGPPHEATFSVRVPLRSGGSWRAVELSGRLAR